MGSRSSSRTSNPAFVRTYVRSPREQDVRLEMGSDDAIRAWVNGKLVHEQYTNRGLTVRQDIASAHLEEGWNELLLEVVDHEGGWQFSCRIRDPEGNALEDLEVEAR